MAALVLFVLSLVASVYAETKYYNGFSLNNNLECHKLGWPPMSEAELGTTFYMYNPSHPNGVIVTENTVDSYGFNRNKNTYFVTHGYQTNSKHQDWKDVYGAFLDVEGANVFAVDWRNGANVANYNYARQNIRVVGNQIALFAEALEQSWSKIYLVGHSLGAHTSGYAGEALRNKGITVTRITGLDPAGPGFWDQDDGRCRLDQTDADFVDNIHTDDDMYGSANDMGHVDFYPNGGSNQPGCTFDVASCSHGRAIPLYTESIRATTCKFKSNECSSWSDYDAGKCTTCGGISGCCNYMGYWATQSCLGRRFLKTKANSPYCES